MLDSARTSAPTSFWASQRRVLQYFHVAMALARRELKARYRGSWLGFTWTFAEPLILSSIFFFVFVIIFQQEYPAYLLYLLSGLLPFLCFQNSVLKATESMRSYSSLIRQVYCPRQVFVLVGILAEVFHFATSLLVLLPFYFYYQVLPPVQLPFVLLATVFLILFSYGLGMVFASLNVFIRDTRIFVGLVIRMWFYLCPIFYTLRRLDNVPVWSETIYWLNPLVPLMSLFRWSILPTEPFPDARFLATMLIEIVAVVFFGTWFFHKNDNTLVKML